MDALEQVEGNGKTGNMCGRMKLPLRNPANVNTHKTLFITKWQQKQRNIYKQTKIVKKLATLS